MPEQLVLPFYVVSDVSYSMTQPLTDGESPLDAVNQIVPQLKDALDANPILSDKIRFSLMDFADDCRTQIPLCNLMSVDTASIPKLIARGGTSFVAAFRMLRQQLDADVRQMKADGCTPHRPAVFFLTDGEPTDLDAEWKQTFQELTDSNFRARPNFIPFGMGDARKEIIDHLVYPQGKMRSFITKAGESPTEAVKKMAEKLIGSVIASASSVSTDGQAGAFVLPDDEESDVWL